jgi:VWFA-related protein
MFRRLAVFCALTVAAVPVLAAKRITVDQLQQLLTSAQQAHRTDDAVVKQLADTELESRVGPADLVKLIATAPGPKSAQLVRALGDASVFLPPPASEIPTQPAPAIDLQKKIIAQTIHYVARVMPSLPNFVATRETVHFDDTEQTLVAGEWPMRMGMHVVGNSRINMAFRDGSESDDPALLISLQGGDKKARKLPTDVGRGLYSWGEFGRILDIVLVDAAKGKLDWARWETIGGQPAAIFKFAVGPAVSHYNVQYCCVSSIEVVNGSYGLGGGKSGSGMSSIGVSGGIVKNGDATVVHLVTGYHGELAVDPATGIILRITLLLDTKPEAPLQHGAMEVEYGPVQIAGATYMCPVRSVAISTTNTHYDSGLVSQAKAAPTMMLNEVMFTSYHHFGSETKLLAEAPPGPTTTIATAASAPLAAGSATANGTQPAAAAESASETASAAAPAASLASPEPADESDSEILVKAVNEMPGMSDDSDAAPADAKASAFTLKANTRLVNVGLVATDKKGKPITDLKLSEIEVYDNGRKQQLRAFRQPSADAPAPAPSAPPAEPEITFTNARPTTETVENAPDLLILLIDEAHIGFQDLTRARQETLRFLGATRANSRVALYSMGEHGFHIIQDVTQDHALLSAKLAAWAPTASSISQAQQLDQRNFQQFDTVHSALDLNSVNGNYTQTPDTMQTSDPALRQLGDNPLRQAMESMIALARHFAAIPGHKSLAWISGDSALVDWEDRALGHEKGAKAMDDAMNRAKESLNEAHIALYAVDATQLLGSSVDSSLQNSSIQLNQASTDNSALGGGSTPRNSGFGRATSQMQTDTRGIQGPVRDLVESTGGRAFNRGSDLAATLGHIEEDTRGLYEVGFDPDSAPDGKFHTLQLKVPDRKDVKLRYRTEYLYAEQLSSTKQRFQQAIWSPEDATGVNLTAEAVPADDATGPSHVKLRIALKGLDVEPGAGGRWEDKLYIFVAQRDDATQKAAVSGDTLKLSLKPETYDTGMPAGIPYHRDVELKSRLGTVRVIVVDGNSGRMGSVTLPASSLNP